MRVVLDTNIIVNAFMVIPSVPGSILDSWLNGEFTLLSCEPQIDEIREVTNRAHIKARIQRGVAGKFVNRMRAASAYVVKLPRVDASPDPFDNYLLALAQAGGADFLVTGDKADLLALGAFGRTRILTARQFLDLL